MRTGALYESDSDRCRVPVVAFATRWWERAAGLLGLPRLERNQGLLIASCRAIHTLGMRYPIDAVFMDHTGMVLKVASDVPPGRLRMAWAASVTLELVAGEAARLGLVAGLRLRWREALSA